MLSAYSIPGVVTLNPSNPEMIINCVCDYFDKTKESIKGKNRELGLSTARHIAMYLIRKKTLLSLPAIGELFNRDHTTVFCAIKKINGFIFIKDEATMAAIREISERLRRI